MNNEKYLKGLKVHRPTISISSPDRVESDSPLTNPKIRGKWLEGINDHGPSDPVKVRYFKQDGDKIVDEGQETIIIPATFIE